MPKLKRELGLLQITIAGTGIILGAGIYALIGLAASSAGNATWLAFLISALVAFFSGLSYAELSSRFKGDAGEFDYIEKAFNKKYAILATISIIMAGIVSSATVSVGFGGYLRSITGFPILASALALILSMSLINYKGIKETSWFNTISTLIEFIGLLLIIILGINYLGKVDYFEFPKGFSGVLSSSALVFFAYMGFESIIKLREEAKNPDVNIPKGLIYSLIITSIVYVLVAISAVSILDWSEIAASEAPLATVAAAVLGSPAFLSLAIIALFSTANTVLITLVTTSRLIYGVAKRKAFPKIFANVSERTRTPHIAVWIIGLLTFLFTLIGDLEFIANLTNVFLFLTFATVNLSLISLRYKTNTKKGFRSPLNIGKFPVLAALGVLTSLWLLVYSIINLI